MVARVQVPPGCYGLQMQDGKKYNAQRNGPVIVEDRHVDAIRTQYGPSGVLVVDEAHVLGTKTFRTCRNHPLRRWQAWTTHCPTCGAETHLEEQ